MIISSLLLTLAAQPPAQTQCCLGAQHVDGISPGGRYRVHGESLDGTGIGAHGPYRFRFTGNLRHDGMLSSTLNFERTWDSKSHFGMTLYVSPSGNGFAIRSSLEDGLTLYGPMGQALWHLESEAKGRELIVDEVSDNGLILTIKQLEEVERARWSTRSGGWFVPLGMWVGEEYGRKPQPGAVWLPVPPEERVFQPDPEREGWIRRAITWNEAKGRADAAQVEELLSTIRSSDDAVADALVDLGPSTLFALEHRVRIDADWIFVRDRILAKAAGHRWPHKNLDLLLALAAFPEKGLAQAALERLQTIVPKGCPIAAASIHTERSKWAWDAEADAYVVR